MRAVKGRDTSIELAVRSLLSRAGYRYRLHSRSLPGKPDIVLPGRRKAIFIHGCFWHGHTCARGARVPKTNRDYWTAKIDRNKTRDARVKKEIRQLGWETLILWECQLKSEAALMRRLVRFLGPAGSLSMPSDRNTL